MRKLFLLLTLSIITAQNIEAKQVSIEEATSNVTKFVRSNTKLKSSAGDKVQLAYTATSGETNNFYVFNTSSHGFVIASADDCTEPILGYSDNGVFNINNIPSALKDMLEEFKKEINYVIEHQSENNAKSTGCDLQLTTSRSPIAPLLSTKWNQGSPYNNLCPDYDESQKCATGCTATAMAQVMNYHKWPDVGVGSNTYTTTINEVDKELSLDFSKTTFDWDNMLNYYNSNANQTQQNAVATLMYNCGVACYMSYGLSSGASYINAHKALANYFKYDKSVKHTMRKYYSIDGWNDLIYNELQNKRVVLYAGYNNEAGHAFVCDGYDSNDFFHINWGWGGTADGYFKLSALTPSSQGIGGSNDGYNVSQEIIYNIKKDQGGNYENSFGFYSNGFTTSTETVTFGDTDPITFSMGNFSFFSAYNDNLNIQVGVYIHKREKIHSKHQF